MNDQLKMAIAAIVLTLISAQGYAAGYMKFDGVKGESQAAKDDKHDKWITLDSVSLSKGQARLRDNQRKPRRIDAPRREMAWDNVGHQKSADDRPTEEVSFYYNKIRHGYSKQDHRLDAPNTPQPDALLVPAMQKVR